MMNLFQMYQLLRGNPQQFFAGKCNVPQEIMNDPNAILNHLLQTGQVSQQQVNQAMGMKNNPMIQQLMQRNNPMR